MYYKLLVFILIDYKASNGEADSHIASLIKALCRSCLDQFQMVNAEMFLNRISVFSYFTVECKPLEEIKILIEQHKSDCESK